MKVINDYCDHCNSQRIVIEIDNYDAVKIFNICHKCIDYALKLIKDEGKNNG